MRLWKNEKMEERSKMPKLKTQNQPGIHPSRFDSDLRQIFSRDVISDLWDIKSIVDGPGMATQMFSVVLCHQHLHKLLQLYRDLTIEITRAFSKCFVLIQC